MKVASKFNRKLVVKTMPDIELSGRKGAVVKILGCGLCGSDIIKLDSESVQNGLVPGHEIVGEIIEINSQTDFKKGDIIVSSHHVPCGECVYCKSGHAPMCKHFKETNFEPGGFSEKIFLSEEHLKNVAYKKPKNLTDIEASFYEPLACCVRAVRRAEVKRGDKVLVFGLGSIGILMAQALKAEGVVVVGCDILDERIDFLKNIGIEGTKNCDKEHYFDAVFLTAGADKTVELAASKVRDGGKIIVFASTPNNAPFLNNDIYYRELTVMGSYSPDLEDLKKSLTLLEDGGVRVGGMSTIYPLEEINKAISDTKKAKILKAYIKF
ncbi:alcohol dehydrogenase catalytic domain-containing protein [bacterium]|nr:alcohol dehydrogenase catalytic domain-containing protein [bacterium]